MLALEYDHLSTDVRLMALGLPARRKPGRPRALSFRERLNVALSWNEKLNARAQVGTSQRHTALAALMKKLIRLQTAGAKPHKIREVQAMMDALGRYITLQVRPPEIDYPTIDQEVAEDFGITARMVLRCRTDFRKFLSHPWNERAHEVEARTAFAAQQLAKRLMTPERFAKREPVKIRSGALWVDPKDSGPKGETIQGPAPLGARCVFLATGGKSDVGQRYAVLQTRLRFGDPISVKEK